MYISTAVRKCIWNHCKVFKLLCNEITVVCNSMEVFANKNLKGVCNFRLYNEAGERGSTYNPRQQQQSLAALNLFHAH